MAYGLRIEDFEIPEAYRGHSIKLERAGRLAKELFAIWNEATGFVGRDTGYYYELLGVIEDAVQISYEEAFNIPHRPEDYGIDEDMLRYYPDKCDYCKSNYWVYGCESRCSKHEKGLPCEFEIVDTL